MALSDKVQSRLSPQRLIELTNQDNTPANSINTTVLAAACNDAIADLQVMAGVVYDDTDNTHVFTAVHGVLYYLMVWRGFEFEQLEKMRERWERLCENLAKVTHRNRIRPTNNSSLTPSPEQINGETVRPDQDRRYFDGIVPRPPRRGNIFHGRPGVEDV